MRFLVGTITVTRRKSDGYALVIGKNGIKMKESAEGTQGGSSSGPDNIHGSIPMSVLAGALTRAANAFSGTLAAPSPW